MNVRIFLLVAFLGGWGLKAEAMAPNVVVTIKPIHSLVAGVMLGVKKPILLMGGERSPHTQPLAPTDAHQINAAQVLIWVGPSYETPLRRAIESRKACQHVITLLDKPGIKLYSVREGGLWGSHSHSSDEEEEDDTHPVSSTDGHLWLDPRNAKAIVKVVAQELSILDPSHQGVYEANAQKMIERLEKLDQELECLLKPVKNKPYVVYHDGTQYFDRRFQTKAIGSLLGSSHYGFNAKHFLQISKYVRLRKIKCIFTEPQFSMDQIQSLIHKTGAKLETLDYLGVGLKADEDAYFLMMRQLGQAFLSGLRDS